MNDAAEIGLTFARELRRNVRSAKGLVSALLFLLGGAAALLVATTFNSENGGPDAAHAAMRAGLQSLYDDPATVESLAGVPLSLFLLYRATLFFLPVLCILIGYDQLAGELQYRTLRYATVRARRENLVVGKALAVWATGAAIAFLLQAIACGVTIARGAATLEATLGYGMHFWSAAVLFSGAFVGLTALVSGAFKTPILALLTTLATAFAWTLLRLLAQHPSLSSVSWLARLTPGDWEPRLLAPDPGRWAVGALVLVAFAAAGVGGACAVLRRRDV